MKNSKTRRNKKLHQTPDGALLHMKNHGGADEQAVSAKLIDYPLFSNSMEY
jgi:hypothetical protein